jgi:hypothetical protein
MDGAELSTIEQLLESSRRRSGFLTVRQRAGAWKQAWGPIAERLPQPYWLYGDDEARPVALGFPLRVSREWESFNRQLFRLVTNEAAYRLALLRAEPFDKASLVEQRRAVAETFSQALENALTHDHGQRLPELLWLVVTREAAAAISQAVRDVAPKVPPHRREEADSIRLTIAERLSEIFRRAEVDAKGRLERQDFRPPPADTSAVAEVLRRDLLPWAFDELGNSLLGLAAFVERSLRLSRPQFARLLTEVAPRVERLLARDGNLRLALSLHEEDLESLSPERLLLHPSVLALLPHWQHPDAPALIAQELQILQRLEGILTRFEVVAALRRAIFPVTVQDRQIVTRLGSQFVTLSSGTRPLDFTHPGVTDSAVLRYGLLYDLADFTHQLEELRRRGRQWEQQGLLSMTRFLQQVDEIRARHRLKFEKFLGDGAFYSARSARPILLAAAELRILYERFRRQGFPFDRGLRLAANVGTYHLVPMVAGKGARPHFEFFGHALVELVRLTTGKTTKEVDDITDFLLAAGYDINRVLEFLEPVRHASRVPEHARERPYAAYVAENGELANLGGVVTEAFLQDLDSELGEVPQLRTEAYGLRWLLLPFDPGRPEKPWIGLRLLGTARLKGIDPGPLVEMVVLDQPPAGSEPLKPGTPLVQTLHRLAGRVEETGPHPQAVEASAAIPEDLCVVSALDDYTLRRWYLGIYSRDRDAVLNAHPVPLPKASVEEPVEAWLFRRRDELATLYQGLCRSGAGMTIPLASLRSRAGFFSCLLASPHHALG